MKDKIEQVIEDVKELSKDFDNQDFDIKRQIGKDMFVTGLLKVLEYRKHFCKGDVMWQDICKECQDSANVQIANNKGDLE